MKTKILSFAVLTIAFIAVNTNALAQKKEKDKILVGRVYTVDIIEAGGKKAGKPISDEISFRGDKLNSKFMTMENKFPAAAYTAAVDSSSETKEITFESTGKNTEGEEVKWEGTITDDAIEGTATITTKKGKAKKEYSFSGTQKIKGKK